MKTRTFVVPLACFLSLFFVSCESLHNSDLDRSGFRLVFNEGTEITGSDVQSYDSATHLLFLKKDLHINQQMTAFSVLVSGDTIYKGIKHSCYLSSWPPETFFVGDCYFYGHKVLALEYYPHGDDVRNDPRIINAFKQAGLLRNGIKCKIDSLKIKRFDSSSEVVCSITLTNYDAFSYYILDPHKMGEPHFSYFTGGVTLQNNLSRESSFLRWSVSYPEYGTLSAGDYSILPGNSKLSFTFSSADYYKMEAGTFSAFFRFKGVHNLSGDGDPALDQKKAKIWIGEDRAILNDITVE